MLDPLFPLAADCEGLGVTAELRLGVLQLAVVFTLRGRAFFRWRNSGSFGRWLDLVESSVHVVVAGADVAILTVGRAGLLGWANKGSLGFGSDCVEVRTALAWINLFSNGSALAGFFTSKAAVAFVLFFSAWL